MDDVERLVAIEAVRALKGRYFYHLDRQDWAQWGAVFTDDALLDVSTQFPGADPALFQKRGVDAIVAMVSASLANVVSAHHGHTPLITVDGADSASGVWAMEDNLFLADGSRMTGYGWYEERYVKQEGAWKIAASKLVRSKVIFTQAVAS